MKTVITLAVACAVSLSVISFHCEIHPTVLATAKITVNIDSGKPKALRIIPE